MEGDCYRGVEEGWSAPVKALREELLGPQSGRPLQRGHKVGLFCLWIYPPKGILESYQAWDWSVRPEYHVNLREAGCFFNQRLLSEQGEKGPVQGSLSATRKAPERVSPSCQHPGPPQQCLALPKHLPGTESSPLLGQSTPVLANSVSKSVLEWGSDLPSNSSPLLARLSWLYCFC